MKGNTREITTIFFDVGGVLLIDFIDWKIKDLAAKYSVEESLLFEAKKNLRPKADAGELSDPDFWKLLLKTVDITADDDDIDLEPYMKKVDGGLDIVNKLKESGYKIAILSNDSVEMSNHRRQKYGFDNIFDHIIISCYHHVIKPNRRIYEIALEEMNVTPEESVFIDDRKENVDTANSVGITGIFFENSTQVTNRLKELRINIK